MKKKNIFIVGGLAIAAIIIAVILRPGKETQEKSLAETKYSLPGLKEVNRLIAIKNYSQAKELLEKKKDRLDCPVEIKRVQGKIYDLNIKTLFSPYQDKCSIVYTVEPGDSLARIARRHNTTVELIKESNGLTSDRIIPGQRLKVNTCKFSIVVDKTQNKLFLRRSGEIFKAYLVATGEAGSTPEGTFKIVNKLVDPTWYRAGAVILPDDPGNILGTRWMGFDKAGYGIHGTTEPESLGQQVTLGCVRMANEEVEELYKIVPTGTKVIIIK